MRPYGVKSPLFYDDTGISCRWIHGHRSRRKPTEGGCMHIVTQLAPTRRRAGFVDVFVDGVEVGAIANEDAIRLRLTTGEAVDDAMPDEAISLSACAGAIQLAERFIAFRPRTIFEVRQRLRRAN